MFAQDASQLPYYQEAVIIGEWLLRATTHQPMLGGAPLTAMYPKKNTQGMSLSRKNHLSTSISQVQMSRRVKTAYRYFGVADSDIPYALKLLRFNYTQALTSRSDFGVSYLSATDVYVEGLGMHLTYNFAQFKNSWFSLRPYFFRSWKEDNFRSQGWGSSLNYSIQSLEWGLELYLGTTFLAGKTIFNSTQRGAALPVARSSTTIKEMENNLGLSKRIGSSLSVNAQVNFVSAEKALLLKLNWAFPHPVQGFSSHRFSTFY